MNSISLFQSLSEKKSTNLIKKRQKLDEQGNISTREPGSKSPLYDEFVKEMDVDDETEKVYSDLEPDTSTEFVNDDNDDDSDYVYSSSCDDSDNDTLANVKSLSEFRNKYSKMNDLDKWTLSTGKIVENALYNFGIKCRHEQ
jgi:hypothetical protein